MPWFFIGLVTLLERILAWFVGRGLKATAFFLTYATFVIGAFVAFLASTFALINGLMPLAPNGVGFGLSILPPEFSVYMSAYLTTLISKRVYDYHKHLTRDFTQATLRF